MIKLIVFDFDGVIITGSNQGYFNCYHKAISMVGVSLDPQEERTRILRRWGQHHRREIEELLKEYPEKVDEAVKVYEANVDNVVYGDNIFLIDGVTDVLPELTQKYILTISSGANRDAIEKLLDKFKIQYFKKVISGYDLDHHTQQKPSPHSVVLLQKEFGVTQKETIVVGDGLTDVQMAQNAGVTPVVVLTGHLTHEEAVNLGVKHIIPSISALPNLIRSL